MASRAVETLLASRHETFRLHRIVVRVGAAAAWAATAVYLVAGAVSGTQGLYLESIGPLLAAVLMSLQIVFGREDGGVALFGSAVIVSVWYTIFGDAESIVPAAVSLVLISSLAMLFVKKGRRFVVPTVAVLLGGIPFLWDLALDSQIMLASVMLLSFVMTHLILASLQSMSLDLNERYQMLFEESPTAALEEDWSEAVEYVRSEYTGKPERFKQFLLAYPLVVRSAVSRAKVVRANTAALSLLEIQNTTRFLGYRDPDVVDDHNMELFVSALVALYESRRSWEAETAHQRRSGERQWLQFRSVDTSSDGDGSSIVVALADITHAKNRNEAMANTVRAKDEFIASVSHELRTPLTAVIGITAELAEDPHMGPEEREELLQLVAGQAAEMSNIVDDLLVAARSDVGTVSIDLGEVDLFTELRSVIEGLGTSVELPEDDVASVVADPRRVRQILRNLLTNAQRYGGPRRRVVVGELRSSVWLEVRDNGTGIPDEEADRIFQPYVTGHSGARGSVGLGLAVARQLAELMGGSLHHERSAAETVFRLELPRSGAREPAMASQSGAD